MVRGGTRHNSIEMNLSSYSKYEVIRVRVAEQQNSRPKYYIRTTSFLRALLGMLPSDDGHRARCLRGVHTLSFPRPHAQPIIQALTSLQAILYPVPHFLLEKARRRLPSRESSECEFKFSANSQDAHSAQILRRTFCGKLITFITGRRLY